MYSVGINAEHAAKSFLIMFSYTDTHAHLDLPEFEIDLDAVLKNASAAGVGRILCVGISLASTLRCMELAGRFPSFISASAGIHPNACSAQTEADLEQIRTLASSPVVTAIGETGLDFHHDDSDPGVQESFFRRHIELAAELGKPLIIHGRRADAEILKILDDYSPPVAGVRHCFDTSAQVASGYLERGLHIAFGGIIAGEGYKKTKRAAAAVPDERLLIETDSPYLTPAGAGRGRNEPAHILHTARALAALRGESPERIAAMTARNAFRLGLFRP